MSDEADDSMATSGRETHVFHMQIKPREPPRYDGNKKTDVVEWAAQVQKYLRFVRHNNREAVAYIALLLNGYAAS